MKYSIALASLAALVSAAPRAVPAANAVPEALKHGSSYATTMGPVTFLYPDVRQWSEDVDNIAPCGSNAGVQNRSEFPLDDGFIAFIAKYVSYSVRLSISYNENPTTQDDFDEWYYGQNVSDELHIGHTCYYMPQQPSSINSGDVATIQVIYMNDDEEETNSDGSPIEGSANQTYYACSDVTFVEKSVFEVSDFALSCFNATNDAYYAESSVDTDTSSATYNSAVVSEISSIRATASSSTSVSSSASASASSAGSSTSGTSSSADSAAMIENPIAGLLGLVTFAISYLI